MTLTPTGNRSTEPQETPPPSATEPHQALRATPAQVRDELVERVQRHTDGVQQTAADVRETTQRRVNEVQARASHLRTQLKFQREKRDPVRYRLSIATVKAVSWLASALPGPVRRTVGFAIGSVVFRLNGGFRANVGDNLRHVLGADAPRLQVVDTSRSIARNGILNIVDLLTMSRRRPEQVLTEVDFAPGTLESLDSVRSDTRGVILLSAHLGSFDMIGLGLASKGYPCTVLTGRTTYRVFFDAIVHLRGSLGGTIVEPTPSGVREIYRSLRRGGVVGMVCDRDFFQNGHPVTFFGAPTTLPPGPVRIARDTGVSILPVFARRVGNRHLIHAMPPFTVERTSDAEADVRAGMARLVEVLETAIGSEPEQWSIFQRVWPDDRGND